MQSESQHVRAADQEALDKIKGWLSPHAQVLTQLFVELQRQRSWVTGVLELGVYHAKYLAFLARCVQGLDVPIVGVDAFLESHGKRQSLEDLDISKRLLLENISSLTGEPSHAILIAGYTHEVAWTDLAQHAPGGFSFVSVDAGHDAPDLLTDMEIANRVLSPHGIAAIDDVFNDTTPGVAEGFFRFFDRAADADLAAFATGGNKVFMCRRAQQGFYFEAARSIAERADTEFPVIAGASLRLRENRANGWSPHLFGYEIVPFPYV